MTTGRGDAADPQCGARGRAAATAFTAHRYGLMMSVVGHVRSREGTMSTGYRYRQGLQVKPGSHVRLRDFDPRTPAARSSRRSAHAQGAHGEVPRGKSLSLRRRRNCVGQRNRSVLVVFRLGHGRQGRDDQARDVRRQSAGHSVHGFKRPSEVELDHTFLWRYWDGSRSAAGSAFSIAPTTRKCWSCVHPRSSKRVAAGQSAAGVLGRPLRRYQPLRAALTQWHRDPEALSQHLEGRTETAPAGTARRPRRWKFSAADLAERGYWHEYMAAYQHMLRSTSGSGRRGT
jgi:hypothetical protein